MTKYRDTGDPDVADSDVTLADGTNLGDVREQLINEVLTKAGRPSLTGPGQRSPQVSFRLPPSLREAAERAASREGITVSGLARKALEEYLARH